MPTLDAVFRIWLGIVPLTAAASFWWWERQRHRDHRFRKALLWSGTACLPGVLLWLEFVTTRLLLLIGGKVGPVYYFPTTKLGVIWLLPLPVLLLASMLKRPYRGAPVGTNLLHVAHITCALSSAHAALYFAIGV